MDRDSWDFHLLPQIVNAFYYPLKNQIHILAGLLRAPFLDTNNPPPMNYAGMGYITSHGVMHGFGVAGRYFQGDGNYQKLWSKKSDKAFTTRSQCVSKQYSRYQAAPKVPINAKRTLEENQADVNGLKLAYQVFLASGRDELPNYQIGKQLLTPEQLFFVSYAQNFCAASNAKTDAYISSRSW